MNAMSSFKYLRPSIPHTLPPGVRLCLWRRHGGYLAADAQISTVRSSAHKVFCTANFLFAVANHEVSLPSLDDYLRPVDAALLFTDGEMVLLSEREADGVLLAQSRSSSQPLPSLGRQPSSAAPKLIHLSYTASEQHETRLETNPLMRAAKRQTADDVQQPAVRPTEPADPALAMVWVFGGWTTVPEHAKGAVKALVQGGRHAVGHIVAVRGHTHMLPRSDLERLLT